jgi:2-oxoglutarate dehydrogenase E2 component (dihydrolipoamide succinyltransferase)
MAQLEVILPKMGESVAEATITTWLKKEGDKVEAEESLVEIATDKVDSEVPAPEDGIIEKILIPEGEVAEVGQAIAIIKTEGADTGASPSQASAPSEKAVTSQESSSPNTSKAPVVEPESSTELNFNSSSRFYSPLVKNIAKKEGITLEELESIKGSGKDGRVTKKDILEFIPNRGTAITSPSPASASPAPSAPIVQTPAPAPVPVGQGDEVIAMDRMRKLIADHMVMSKHTSPHVTSFVEADVTNIVNWRNKHKDAFQKREGEKITFTPIFIEAIVQAIKDFPMINVSIDGDNIIKKGHINIGLATALPSGNLIVPVIKDADTLNLLGITKKVNDLARRARENKLSPDEIQGGTYTLTNVGSFGNVLGTPIINQPQVAIMAVGAIQKKPAVIETPEGEFIGIRQKMYLSHSYDHRVVDGALGGMFVRRVADYLENFDTNKVI